MDRVGRCLGWAIRREGVALGVGLVFVGLSDARVVALDEKTGALVWNVYVGDNPRDKGQGHLRRAPVRGRPRVGWTQRGQRMAWAGRCPRSQDRQGDLEVLRDSRTRRTRARVLAAGERHLHPRRRGGLAGGCRRCCAGHRVLRDRQRRSTAWRRRSSRRQPVSLFGRCARYEDRKAQVALSGHPPRRVGS